MCSVAIVLHVPLVLAVLLRSRKGNFKFCGSTFKNISISLALFIVLVQILSVVLWQYGCYAALLQDIFANNSSDNLQSGSIVFSLSNAHGFNLTISSFCFSLLALYALYTVQDGDSQDTVHLQKKEKKLLWKQSIERKLTENPVTVSKSAFSSSSMSSTFSSNASALPGRPTPRARSSIPNIPDATSLQLQQPVYVGNATSSSHATPSTVISTSMTSLSNTASGKAMTHQRRLSKPAFFSITALESKLPE
jgi:hypothetical protein